jgi:hypothetical protein
MYRQLIKALALLAFAACANAAVVETPGRAGRISLVQGQVSISGEVGTASEAALLNWPVTSNNQISTARDARAEIRVGSTSVRLDGDSALDIELLDDDLLKLRLHYGSVSVRVRNGELARGFELTTPQGRVRLQDPSTFRVDADRRPDTTLVNVFDGAVLVEGGGASLTVRSGRRAELQNDELHTGLAVRDGFDDWAALRDQRDDRVNSTRYVSQETTGYEDLDQYGSWTSNNEYGAIWTPRTVGVNWAPYRDGRWAWVAPWGWTWVDNAPWGYAPFHYGRWVMVGHRWCWAPGRHTARPVWAPALVGWVGGNNWQLSFNVGGSQRRGPALGWYPLSPRDTFVPGYHARTDHVRQINAYNGGRDDHRDDRRGGRQHEGMTVVPQGHFDHRGSVMVPTAPRALVAPTALRDAPSAAPPVVQGPPLPPPMLRAPTARPEFRPESREGTRHEGRPEVRRDRDDAPAAAPRQGVRNRGEFAAPAAPVTPAVQAAPAPQVAPAQPAAAAQPSPVPLPPAMLRPPRDHRQDTRQDQGNEPRQDQRNDRRGEQRTERQQPAQASATAAPAAAPQSAPAAVPTATLRREPERAPAPVAVPAAPRATPAAEAPRAQPAERQDHGNRQDRQEKQEKQEKREKTDTPQDNGERAGRPDRR